MSMIRDKANAKFGTILTISPRDGFEKVVRILLRKFENKVYAALYSEAFMLTGSFKEKENLTPEQKELKELRKANTPLQMENDTLK